jgi:hypothetical protein
LHDSSVWKEDDDNPIKSILKKSKKQKLDSFTEVGPKLHSVLSAKTSSRIASQVTVVNEQKTPSKNDKARIPLAVFLCFVRCSLSAMSALRCVIRHHFFTLSI